MIPKILITIILSMTFSYVVMSFLIPLIQNRPFVMDGGDIVAAFIGVCLGMFIYYLPDIRKWGEMNRKEK